MSKEEIIAAVKACAERLGHAPSVMELVKNANVTKHDIRKTFGNHTRLLAASGLERQGCGYLVKMESLFADWAATVRKLGKVPTMSEYELHGRYSVRPFARRYKSWKDVATAMSDYALQQRLEGEWKDVLDVVAEHCRGRTGSTRTFARTRLRPADARVRQDRPVYGQPMHLPFSYAPTNEQGVLFVFGGVAEKLGFSVTRVQTGFPDVEAMREVEANRWQPVRIELEYESRNFIAHMHPVDGCELIVCWIHNWEDCPLEVIELREVIQELSK
ncbi:MAG TPA: hypothetical protein VKH81_22715 [Candidatus Angelobacter sp.]|nr:hypothetical protein [Candidatus Angelobacter sp.]